MAESSISSKLVVQVSQADLLCRAGCGFYGNPEWQGYCSKCYRHHQAAVKRQQDFAKNRSLLSFDQFQEKKKHHADRKSNTFRSILRKSPSRNEISGPGSFPVPSLSTTVTAKGQHHLTVQRKLSNESQAAREKLLCFLHELPKPVAHDISRKTQNAVERIQQSTLSSDEISEMIQDFYQIVGDRLSRSQLMKESKICGEEVLEQMENYVCVRAYIFLFCRETDEEVADLSLQDRIRSLHWVTSAGFLETHLDFSVVAVREKIDSAVTEIIDMNSRRSPKEKLNSLVQCSKYIFEALKESQGAPASADEYLPALIYVVLKANPPLLQSNINFISRFSLPSKLCSGEAGYYFTNLCCAKNYIQNMNADSLKMPKEEFEAYTSGQLVPPLAEASSRCHQAVKSMENVLVELSSLSQRKDALQARLEAFHEKALRETDELLKEVQEFSVKYPDPEPLAAWLNADLSPEKLPPPLEPVPVGAEKDPRSL